MAHPFSLEGRSAIVTGASEGIGSAVARKLAEEGVRVAICARTEAKLKETAAEIAQATGMQIEPIPADLRALAGCQGFVAQAAERLGGIDILVNNAGASAFGAFVDLPDDAFVDAINGKLLGYIRCAKAVIPHLRRRGGGTIINITGTTQQAVPLHTPGSACNAAIRMFSKELSMELGPLNIRVNSVAPGRIQTARADRLLDATAAAQGTSPEALLSQLVRTIPSGRLGTIRVLLDEETTAARDAARTWSGRIVLERRATHILIVSDGPGRQDTINRRLEAELSRLDARFSVTEPLAVLGPAELHGTASNGNGRH